MALGFYNEQRALQLMNTGLSWPQPRQADSLPMVDDEHQLEQALKYIARATVWQPSRVQGYRLASEIYAARGDWSAAAASLEQARSLQPRNVVLAWEVSLIYEQMMSTNDQSSVKQAWTAAGIGGTWFFDQGEREQNTKHNDHALVWYKRATILDPRRGDAWYAIARIYVTTEDWEKAVPAYREVTQRISNNRDIWYELGQLYEKREDWPHAVEAYKRGIPATSGRVGLSLLYYGLGNVLQNHMTPPDAPAAMSAYVQALRLDQFANQPWAKTETYLRSGQFFESQHHWDEAVQAYGQALLLNPRHYWASIALGKLEWQLGQSQNAEDAIRHAIASDPQIKQGYKLLGKFLTARGNLQEARSVYNRVLELDPQDQETRASLAALP
ncbi:MAG: tetratricopeptide repeat protein [Herpetosiphonaceae bacterium]|nr:tetratricopeptide repeat protein [Herpetosiphonaceae bacterium]